MPNHLSYPFRYRWYTYEDVSVIGWSYNQDGKLITERELAAFFKNLDNEQAFADKLKELNGHFSVVIKSETIEAAAVDHIRSFPLLYDQRSPDLKVYCSVTGLSISVDPVMAECFVQSWCTPGNHTLDSGIKQLLPGQYFWKKTNIPADIQPVFYYKHYVADKSELGKEHLKHAGLRVVESVFGRLTSQLKKRNIIIPLSGGYDSRLILAMLHRAGMKNITAYTYGRPDSHEVVLARYITKTLNVDWHFIEYNEEIFEAFFSQEWKEYSVGNHFLSALPHEQDFFALHTLRRNNQLPDDFVALPGYCGDLLGGSITANKPKAWNVDGLRSLIRKKHFGSMDLPTELNISSPINDRSGFYDAYQQYFVENKVSKFIVNAVRVYEYFGGDWIMPLWDRELVDFFYGLPYDLRENQLLYNEILFEKIFTPLGVGIYKPGYDDNYPNQMKERVKSYMPSLLTDQLKKIKRNDTFTDPNGLQILNKMIFNGLDELPNTCPKEVNITHASYFLQNLKK